MKTSHECHVAVSDFREQRYQAIADVVNDLLSGGVDIDDSDVAAGDLAFRGDHDFAFSEESSQEFVTRLTHAIWKANRGYCKLIVEINYKPDGDDYDEWFEQVTRQTAQATDDILVLQAVAQADSQADSR